MLSKFSILLLHCITEVDNYAIFVYYKMYTFFHSNKYIQTHSTTVAVQTHVDWTPFPLNSPNSFIGAIVESYRFIDGR